MFPVPQHLPRTGGENLSSDIPERDPVLDLLQPLISQGESSKFTGVEVKGVRESLEKAVNDNKGKTHDLVINNFPSISSQIQLSTSLHSDIRSVRDKVSHLEAQIDHSDPQTSFLPPLISSLNRHFSASSSRSAAQAHITALRTLSKHTERIKKLEEAVWSGHSADEWVLEDLRSENGYFVQDTELHGEEILKGTKIMKAIEAKETLLKSMVIEQITEGFNSAISLSSPASSQGTTLTVQSNITLQHPRTNRPQYLKPSTLPHYSLSDMYSALSKLGLLEKLLQTLLAKLQKDIIQPIVVRSHRISISSTDKLSILRLERSSGSSPGEALEGVKSVLDFTLTAILPPSSNIPEREIVISSLTKSAFQSVLDSLVLPSLPPTLSGVSKWLITLQQAVEVESTFSRSGDEVIKPFFDNEAGTTWAQQRRYAAAEEIRRLIIGGWSGWESTEKEIDQEVIAYVEVEVDEPMALDIPTDGSEKKENGSDDFGWGFEESPKKEQTAPPSGKEIPESEDVSMEDDGWGFEEPQQAAGPSSPPRSAPISSTSSTAAAAEEEETDGWDLDPSPPQPASIAEPEAETAVTIPLPAPKAAKPAREAKRLGKKVAKVKKEEEYDPWASPDPGEEISKHINGNHQDSQSIPQPVQAPSPPPADKIQEKQGDDGWGWDDDTAPIPESESTTGAAVAIPTISEPVQPKKRKEIREERSMVKERYLVSTACETLVDIVRSVLADIEQMKSLDLPSASFQLTNLELILTQAIKETFTLYRALLPTHFVKRLRDVPSLGMQAYNDSIHLSRLISNLTIQEDLAEEKDRLLDLSEHIFENQIELQKNALIESLDELNELQETNEDKVFRKDEKIIKAIIHDLESLDRVIKPVLPSSKHLEIISYLVTTLITRLTNDILNLGDITEIESNRLTDLFKFVHDLERLFETRGGIIRYVGGGWLKFCYISEILQASLVDITYLIDSGSLIDFTPDELIGLVRALFAISDKRDSVIDKIEKEGTGGGAERL